MITQQLESLCSAIKTSDKKLLSTNALKQLLLSNMPPQKKTNNIEQETLLRVIDRYCTKTAVLALVYYAIQEVNEYSLERLIGGKSIQSFRAVSDKLEHVTNKCWLIEAALEKIGHDIFLSNGDYDFLTIDKYLSRLSYIFKSELIPHFDNILFIMGAKGYMISHAVANIWEEINAWHDRKNL